MSNLPTVTPAETVKISPEALEVANVFLQCQDMNKTADELDLPIDVVSDILARREVKSYIDSVFFNIGFNNRFRMRKAMDAIIQKKFQELEESETGSSKDIAELLALSHKMTMEEMARQIELEKLRASNIRNQVNVQINDSGGSKYDDLIKKLIGGVSDANGN